MHQIRIKNVMNTIFMRPAVCCFSLMLSNSFVLKWSRPLMVFVLLLPFCFFIFFGIMDEKLMSTKLRMPQPFSVIHLYPSRVPLLNLNSFFYLINNDVCGESKIFAIVIVHSHPANRDRRDAMRRNIPNEDLNDLGMRRVFLLARAEWNDQELYSRTPQEVINEENIVHRDIIQGNFKEHYHNLSYKHVMGLQWANTYCPQTKFIIKMDDDIITDLYRFRDLLKTRYFTRKMLILGLLEIAARPIRDPESKWYVSEKEYSHDMYPSFVSGWTYAITSDAAVSIVNKSIRYPYFWIDDVYVTGVLAEATGTKREGLNRFYTTHAYHMKCCVELPRSAEYFCDFLAGPSEGDITLMEKVLNHARSCFVQPCMKRKLDERVSKYCIVAEDPNHPHLGIGRGEVFKI